MSSTPFFGSWSERLRYRLYGLVFVLVVLLLVVLMVMQYNKAFTPVYHVTVDSDRAGLQLVPHSDVKVRGLIVGEVRKIRQTADGAAIDLALDPDKARLIPANSSARMLPKTVFGEKFVDIVPPAGVLGGRHLRNGDVIPQDRSTIAVEVNQVLNDVMPILNEVEPAKLNATLNALATALQGRGDQIGQMLVDADDYLKRLNPHLPTIVHDLRQLAIVSDNLGGAAPDLISIMQNLQTTNKTIVDKEPQLVAALDKGIGLTGDATDFAANNEPRIEGAMIANRKALALLAKYSPSVPCVFQGMARLTPRLVDAMGGRQPGVHVTLELVKPRPGYKPGLDRPEFKDHRNPRCYGLPNPKVPFPQYQELDGTEDDQWWAGGAGRSLSSVLVKPGSSDDDSLLKGLMGPAMGTRADQVSDLAALLYRPATSGMVVTAK
ncbi:MCE family protein [Actinoallomurus spadix]|uniref:MCE family protein n=1 Tax=Actinoallomurus spadix TaxID=79912 RepID=A0ABN0WCM5_9ACTN|nr:MCE family protein [Actinoallomurus spadix]MCO5990347.1 MCE family protein [Actinoallomurus spadix]